MKNQARPRRNKNLLELYMMNIFRNIVCLFAGIFLLATAVDGSSPYKSYLVQPRDVLEIKIWRHPDLDSIVEVDKDGNISLPLLGIVQVGDKTSQDIEADLTKLWGADYIKDPSVSVQIQKKKFFVLGEVKEPGSYDLEGDMTILKAISMAGGFADYAAEGSVYILRGKNSETAKIEIDISKIQKGQAEDIELQPGDIITVPQSFF